MVKWLDGQYKKTGETADFSWLFSGRIPRVSGGGTCGDRVIDQGTGLGDSVGASMGLPVVPVWSLAGIDPD